MDSCRKRKIVKLYFDRGVHIGLNKISDAESCIMADTLLSALCHEAAKQRPHGVDSMVEQIVSGKLKWSDAFPFVGHELFLPKPFINRKSSIKNSEIHQEDRKLWKNIRYIPLSQWANFMQLSEPKTLADKLGQLGMSQLQTGILYQNSGNHEIYRIGVHYFRPDSGLYFILECEESLDDQLDDLLYQLSYSGIGGKRSRGLGRFEFLVEDAPEILERHMNDQTNPQMTLSISLPKQEELKDVIQSAYGFQLIRRGGFITRIDEDGSLRKPIRKRDLYMITSGSVFNKRYEGMIYNVSPDLNDPIYRYGMPMFIGVGNEEQSL